MFRPKRRVVGILRAVRDVLTILCRIDRKLNRVLAQGETLMSKADDLKAQIARIDAATDNIAADVRNLTAQITTALTDAQVTEIQTGLEAVAVKLEATAAETPDV